MNTNDLGENHGNAVQAGYVGHLSVGSAPDRPPVPRQLPFASPGFVGRTEHLASLDRLLTDTDATVVAAVVGTAGVGKTSLVVQWARQAQRHFPGGTLYVNLRGYGPGTPATPGDVLADFLTALGISPERVPPHQDARAALYRSLLARRRVLIVLDNATDVAQVRPLLPNGPGCVVVTSRADLKGLEVTDGAWRIRLPLFHEHEAEQLIASMLGRIAEPDAVAELIRACARLPLAIKMAAGRIATHPHLTLTELVEELAAEHQRWEALSIPADEDSAVRTVFGWSYGRLSADLRLTFRRLGMHPTPEIGAHAVAAVCGVGLPDARRLLAGLADQHLIEIDDRGRYHCHDLLRAYAADLTVQDDDREAARLRMIEWYAHHARSAYRTVYPGRRVQHERFHLATSGSPEITFASAAEAWAWGDMESVNAIAAVRVAAHHGHHVATVVMGDISTGLLAMAGQSDNAMEVCQLGLAAARALGDHAAECWLLQSLGQLYRWINRWSESADAFDSALALARELDSTMMQAEVLCHLGWGSLQLDRFIEARAHLEAASKLIAGEDGYLPGFIEFCLSGVYAELGDHRRAFWHGERSLALLRQSDVRGADALSLQAMARARQVAGAHRDAIALCEQALEAETGREVPRIHARLLETLGESLRHVGDVERAIACWREALAVYEVRGDHRAPDLRERLATEVSASSG